MGDIATYTNLSKLFDKKKNIIMVLEKSPNKKRLKHLVRAKKKNYMNFESII